MCSACAALPAAKLLRSLAAVPKLSARLAAGLGGHVCHMSGESWHDRSTMAMNAILVPLPS